MISSKMYRRINGVIHESSMAQSLLTPKPIQVSASAPKADKQIVGID